MAISYNELMSQLIRIRTQLLIIQFSVLFANTKLRTLTLDKIPIAVLSLFVDLNLKVIDFPMSAQPNLISKAQLSLRNGQDKPQVWEACKGKVYDVTASCLWKNRSTTSNGPGDNSQMN